MWIVIGLLIIAFGAFCQSSSYVPINKIKDWHWESFWLVQGIFAWLIFPLIGALLAVPSGHSLFEIYAQYPKESLLTILFGALWGIGGLTFGLSMRYLGVALGQSIALGTCSALGAILGPVFTGHANDLTSAVITDPRGDTYYSPVVGATVSGGKVTARNVDDNFFGYD